tara:strand:+ start:285 stop:878 length:594 start_codon:yes stop_codon:yes gene_type:complete
MKLFLVRHGETESNKQKISDGQTELPTSHLTKEGETQAKKLAERLKDEEFDVVFVSDLHRTKETAEIILKNHKNKPKHDKRIRESHGGDFEGKGYGAFSGHIKENNLDRYTFKPEGGESLQEFHERVKDFLDEVVEHHAGKKILVITHGGVIRTMMNEVTKTEQTDTKTHGSNNCSLTVFHVDKDVEVELFNCIKHL